MLDGLLAASPQPGSASRPEVAVPKKWTVPSGKVWGTSKLQVTRSPCALCLDLAVVSLWVGPPGGVNCRWPESQQAAAFVVAQGLDVHPGPLGQRPVRNPWSLIARQRSSHRLGVDVAGQEQPQPGRLGPLHPAQMSKDPLAEVLQAPGVLVGVQGAHDRPIWYWCWAVDRNACLGHGYLHG